MIKALIITRKIVATTMGSTTRTSKHSEILEKILLQTVLDVVELVAIVMLRMLKMIDILGHFSKD